MDFFLCVCVFLKLCVFVCGISTSWLIEFVDIFCRVFGMLDLLFRVNGVVHGFGPAQIALYVICMCQVLPSDLFRG